MPESLNYRGRSKPLLDFVDLEKFYSELWKLNHIDQRSMQTYLDEAIFFSEIILEDLSHFPRGARIIEVGSGAGWLINYFREIQYEIVGIEPHDSGFEKMGKFRQIMHLSWKGTSRAEVIEDTAENFTLEKKAIYAYSVNVMEHVKNIEKAIKNVNSNLEPEGQYRFICPNYSFPYEPHFNIFAPFNKSFTFWLNKSSIIISDIDPKGELWAGLNWISPRKIIDAVLPTEELVFSRKAFSAYLNRIENSLEFQERKGPVFTRLARLLFPLKSVLIPLFPLKFVPVLDVRIRKLNE